MQFYLNGYSGHIGGVVSASAVLLARVSEEPAFVQVLDWRAECHLHDARVAPISIAPEIVARFLISGTVKPSNSLARARPLSVALSRSGPVPIAEIGSDSSSLVTP